MHIHNWGYSILYMYDCGAIYLFLIVLYKPNLIPGMIVSSVQKLGCDWLLQWVLLPREFGTVIIHYGIPFKDLRGSQKDAGVSRVYVDDTFSFPGFQLSIFWVCYGITHDHCSDGCPFLFQESTEGWPEGPEREKVWVDWHLDGIGIGIAANLEWHCGSPGHGGSPLSSRIGFKRQRRGIELLNNRGGISVVNHGEQIPELRGGFVMENDWTK